MPEALTTRLTAFAASLREAGAIRSDAVEQAFASVPRHQCVPEFRYGPQTIRVAQDQLPESEVLDIVYSHQSLLTSTGRDGGLPSSSSAPPLMARMLEALELEPGMRVLDIGAGTGYNAALIATITGAPVHTIDADATTAHAAAESIRRLGLDHQVTVRRGDGYLGAPSGAPYDRIIITCGVAGLSPPWLDQLTPDGLILAPIAHGGVHPILAARRHDGVHAKAALWADFMPAAGPLRPPELVGHDPADYLAPAPITRIPEASPARTAATYDDLWFFLATRDDRITRAYLDDDSIDPSKGTCALHVPACGTAWVQIDGTIAAVGEAAVAATLHTLIRAWEATGQPELTQFTSSFAQVGSPQQPLLTPRHWTLADVRC
ncbi:MAG: class I SAM-dependent methyltransferase [Pseudonocardiales bacterium]|nr:class I SAM-dependent methyltransferase [Pseudonocardiales bacterium]